MNDLTTEQLEVVEEIEPTLGVEKGFFRKLLAQENDWSFIIKTHALIESVLTRLIQVSVEPDALGEFTATLNLSGGRHSKTKLLRDCKLLTDTEEKFVRGLSRIRNRLVHNVRYTKFTLEQFVRDLGVEEKKQFLSETCGIFTDHEDTSKAANHREQSMVNPRGYIWSSALHVIALGALRTSNAELKIETDALRRQSLESEIGHLKQLLAQVPLFPLPKVDGLAIYRKILAKHQKEKGANQGADKTPENNADQDQ
jgi:hypothetical protein